jgi:hypothetical protein
MAKFQEHVSLHETAVQRAAKGEVDVPKPRRRRKTKEEPVLRITTISAREHDRLFGDVHEGVYEKALELADGNWRRLEKVDTTTVMVHNNEVH